MSLTSLVDAQSHLRLDKCQRTHLGILQEARAASKHSSKKGRGVCTVHRSARQRATGISNELYRSSTFRIS